MPNIWNNVSEIAQTVQTKISGVFNRKSVQVAGTMGAAAVGGALIAPTVLAVAPVAAAVGVVGATVATVGTAAVATAGFLHLRK